MYIEKYSPVTWECIHNTCTTNCTGEYVCSRRGVFPKRDIVAYSYLLIGKQCIELPCLSTENNSLWVAKNVLKYDGFDLGVIWVTDNYCLRTFDVHVRYGARCRRTHNEQWKNFWRCARRAFCTRSNGRRRGYSASRIPWGNDDNHLFTLTCGSSPTKLGCNISRDSGPVFVVCHDALRFDSTHANLIWNLRSRGCVFYTNSKCELHCTTRWKDTEVPNEQSAFI